jgi:hypothetical protein
MSYSDGGMGAAGLLHRRERQERTALPAAGATEHSHVYAGSMASCLQSLLVVPWRVPEQRAQEFDWRPRWL